MQANPLRAADTETPANLSHKPDLNLDLRRKWLRRLFWLWVGGAMVVGAYLLLAGPLVPYTGLESSHVALALPVLMVLMLASGLTWLIMLVTTPPSRR